MLGTTLEVSNKVLYNPITKTTFFIPILDIGPIQCLGILYECVLFDAKTLQYKIFVILYNLEQQLLITCCYNSQIQKWSWKDINIHITTKIVYPRHEYQNCTIANNQIYYILDNDPFWIMVSIDIETNIVSREDAPWPSSGRPILFSCQDRLLAMFTFSRVIEDSTFQNCIEWRIDNIVWKSG